MKKGFFYIVLLIIASQTAFSQGSAGNDATYESRYIVDMPTAGMIPESSFSIYGLAFSHGGILGEMFVSPLKDFLIGVSFGGTGIIGESDMKFQKLPAVHIRYRIIEEKISFPAILIGISTQGRGLYSSSAENFEVYSPGVFLAMSKNFNWFLGDIALHGGINYSFEAKPEIRTPNFYAGFEQSLGPSLSVNAEFNAAINEHKENLISEIGVFNTSLRWSLTGGITLEFLIRDIFSNRIDYDTPSRYIGLEYIKSF